MTDDSHVHELLRTVLQSFDPPDHVAGFHAELRRRLREDEFAVRRERRSSGRRRLAAAGAAAIIAAALAVSGFSRFDRSEVACAAEVGGPSLSSVLAVPQRLDGVKGEVVTDVRSVPHFWAATGGLVVTGCADLAPHELLRVAGSLA